MILDWLEILRGYLGLEPDPIDEDDEAGPYSPEPWKEDN